MNILIGLISGIVSGMGIGGGAILIPALIIFDGINQQTAQGINLVYFLPTAIAALIIHLKNKNVDIRIAAVIAVSGIAGTVPGALFAGSMKSSSLRIIFGIFLLLVGVYEIYKGIRLKFKN